MCNTMMRAMLRMPGMTPASMMAMLDACIAMCQTCMDMCMMHADDSPSAPCARTRAAPAWTPAWRSRTR
jgi:hypothetical protein